MKAEENNHLCRLSFHKMSSEFKCSVREGCDFSDKVSQNQACLRHLNLGWHKLRQTLESLLAKWLYSKHCQAVSYYTIVYLLDKYLFYLTTVVSKQKTFLLPFWNKTLAVRGGYGWKHKRGFPAAVLHPDAFCVRGCWPPHASPFLELCWIGVCCIILASGSAALV